MELFGLLADCHQDFKSWVAMRFRTRAIRKVLAAAHAQELAESPLNLWPQIKERQIAQIHAVQQGKLDIVDRKSWPYPLLPASLHRLNQPVLKNTPYNIRKFSETPIPRRAINLIKNSVLALDWKVGVRPDVEENADTAKRARIATVCFRRPNNVDSWGTLMEQVVEDAIIGGFGTIEPQLTPSPRRPIKMWAVDGATIRIFGNWKESLPDQPKYAQVTGLAENHVVTFLADELVYVRDNVRSSTPFGLGKMEVAFMSINSFLTVQDMAGKAGGDQTRKTWLWWETPQVPAHVQTIRRHIQNDLEGQSKISLVAGLQKPDVLEVTPVQSGDLLLDWQEFLIRVIANAFDISAFSLGLEKDVNRNTSEVLSTADFRSAVVPMARKLQEHLTRDVLHGLLQWKDLEFHFVGLNELDPETRSTLNQQRYAANALLPDEWREEDGRPPLPGGWGQLTSGQMDVVTAIATALAKAKAAPPAEPAPSPVVGGPTEDSSAIAGVGGPKLPGSRYSAKQILQMSRKELEAAARKGWVPSLPKLRSAMEQGAPGILQQLSDEVREFLEKAEENDSGALKPAKVTAQDVENQKGQFKKFQKKQAATRKKFGKQISRSSDGSGV